MAELVAASHELGLEVQMCPWGVGRTFGGEAESRWVTFHPEACQVLDDGRRVATGCLNNPVYRAFCKEWADAALEAGPTTSSGTSRTGRCPSTSASTIPSAGPAAATSAGSCPEWTCRGSDTGGAGVPRGVARRLPPRDDRARLVARRQEHDLPAAADRRAARRQRLGRRRLAPGLAVLATDPYWKNFDESAESFVGRFARLLAETAARHGVDAQMWVPSFGLTRDDIPDLEAAIAATRAAGIDDVWTWGYEACGHMTQLATPDAPLVWEAVTAR